MLAERGVFRIGLSLRAGGLSFRALVVKGAASGEGEGVCEEVRIFADNDRCGGSREGDKGELGEGEVDFDITKRKAGPLDGDRESERRSCLNAEAGST